MRQPFRPRAVRAVRIAGYLLLATFLLGGLLSGPQAWATPTQDAQQQTVPTRTPRPPVPTAPPTSAPPPTAEPRPTEAPPPTATSAPTATQPPATPTVASAASSLSLHVTLVASPLQVWSGVTVVYTLTVENRASAAARDVVLVAQLPVELQPAMLIAPAGAQWNGASLQATLPELAAGAQAQAVFSAQVAPRVAAGKIIVVRAGASVGGGTPGEASAQIAMPPAELPAVGRDAEPSR